jgi:hypothetical protein
MVVSAGFRRPDTCGELGIDDSLETTQVVETIDRTTSRKRCGFFFLIGSRRANHRSNGSNYILKPDRMVYVGYFKD